jgi:hypothetical protein
MMGGWFCDLRMEPRGILSVVGVRESRVTIHSFVRRSIGGKGRRVLHENISQLSLPSVGS